MYGLLIGSRMTIYCHGNRHSRRRDGLMAGPVAPFVGASLMLQRNGSGLNGGGWHIDAAANGAFGLVSWLPFAYNY